MQSAPSLFILPSSSSSSSSSSNTPSCSLFDPTSLKKASDQSLNSSLSSSSTSTASPIQSLIILSPQIGKSTSSSSSSTSHSSFYSSTPIELIPISATTLTNLKELSNLANESACAKTAVSNNSNKSTTSVPVKKKERPIKPNIKPNDPFCASLLTSSASTTFVSPRTVSVGLKPTRKRRQTSEGVRKERKKPRVAENNSSTTKKPKVDSKSTEKNINEKAGSVVSYSNTTTSSKSENISKSLTDSIEYLSSNWTKIFRTGNETHPDTLNLFRQYHCADCLKSFQSTESSNKDSTTSSSSNNKENLLAVLNRSNMNTPPAPLQPLVEETFVGYNYYFGQQPVTTTTTTLVAPSSATTSSNDQPNFSMTANTTNSTSSSFDLATSIIKREDHDQVMNESNTSSQAIFTPSYTFITPDLSHTSDIAISMEEKRLSLGRKLAQQRPKQELVQLGILPPPRVPMQHYDQLKHLEKARLQDILENKLERRPNREILIQKNILPNNKAAPSLQLKCNELKRARLADDLNEKLAKRPGPLELVESGILISADTNLTEAIKHGKIVYPRTTALLDASNQIAAVTSSHRHHPYQRNSCGSTTTTIQSYNNSPAYAAATPFNPDDIGNLNFNLSSVENEDSNASSQASSTLNSMSSSSIASSSFVNQNGGDITVNYADNITSPPSATSSSNSGASLAYRQQPQQVDMMRKSTQSASSKKYSQKIASSVASLGSSSSSTSMTSQQQRNKTSSGGSSSQQSKKLIFHEYKGPNQKSSKTSMSIGTNAKSSGSSNKPIKIKSSSFSSPSSNIGSNESKPSLANNNGYNITAVSSQVDMNPSSNETMNFNLDQDNSSNDSVVFFNKQIEELDAYRIRLEQQKMFLLLTSGNEDQNLIKSGGDVEMQVDQIDHLTVRDNFDTDNIQINGINPQTVSATVAAPLPPPAPTSTPSFISQLQPVVDNSTSSTQIQLVPISDIQSFDHLKNLYNIVPVEAIAFSSATSTTPSSASSLVSESTSNRNNSDGVSSNATSFLPATTTFKILGSLNPNFISTSTSNPSVGANNAEAATMPIQLMPTIQLEMPSNNSQQINSESLGLINTTTTLTVNTNHESANAPKTTTATNSSSLTELSLDTMSVNQLREECTKRNLPKNGVKQKLIERLKSHLGQQQVIVSAIVKSPDSGVNMDGSPSFLSCEPSPCGSVHSSANGSFNIINATYSSPSASLKPIQPSGVAPAVGKVAKQVQIIKNTGGGIILNGASFVPNVQQTGQESFDLNEIKQAQIQHQLNFYSQSSNTHPGEQTSSEPEFLSRVNSTSSSSASSTSSSVIINCMDSGISSLTNSVSAGVKTSAADAAKATADLEQSLKSSAEILRNLSFAGKKEDLQKLEQQMQESMQLIEMLKSASNKPPPQQVKNTKSTKQSSNNSSAKSTTTKSANKLRPINSMPSNLKDLGNNESSKDFQPVMNGLHYQHSIDHLGKDHSAYGSFENSGYQKEVIPVSSSHSGVVNNNSVAYNEDVPVIDMTNQGVIDWNSFQLYSELDQYSGKTNGDSLGTQHHSVEPMSSTTNSTQFTNFGSHNGYVQPSNQMHDHSGWSMTGGNQQINVDNTLNTFTMNNSSGADMMNGHGCNGDTDQHQSAGLHVPWELLDPDYSQIMNGYF